MFDLFAKGLNWMMMMINKTNGEVSHYLDDFLGIVRAIPDAESFDRNFAEICSDLGLKFNEKKNKQGTVVEFLGIELDTHLMQARLPAEKLQKAKDLVQSTLNKSTITRNELDTLLGFLCFAAKVVVEDFPRKCRARRNAALYNSALEYCFRR